MFFNGTCYYSILCLLKYFFHISFYLFFVFFLKYIFPLEYQPAEVIVDVEAIQGWELLMILANYSIAVNSISKCNWTFWFWLLKTKNSDTVFYFKNHIYSSLSIIQMKFYWGSQHYEIWKVFIMDEFFSNGGSKPCCFLSREAYHTISLPFW